MKVRRLLVIAALTVLAVGAPLWLSGRMRGTVRALSREGISPYLRLANAISRGLEPWRGLMDSMATHMELQSLRRQAEQMEMALRVAESIESENRALRRQLDFARQMPRIVSAEVLSMGGADGWGQRIRVSKGQRDGIRLHAPVVAPQGLVGRVIEVTANTADVLLITDINSRVACVFDPEIPTARGILKGGGRNPAAGPRLQLLHTAEPMRLAYLDRDASILPATRVVTSGLGGVYPPGLPVGRVVRTALDPSGLFQRAEVEPFVDTTALRMVGILVASPPSEGGRTR